ncbi:response regulator [Variovorax sp. GT1P44]|uniref:response regulator n=1 Tax=Variovorax sp. GT1P44 TaxID=3443742 RepID=UPI003F46722C
MPGNITAHHKDKGRDTVKVLLVDDSVAIQKSFGTLLQAAAGGIVISYAEDVASALATIASNPPKLIVLDAKLRGDDRGIDVLRYVTQRHPEIKVVMFCQFGWPSARKTYIDEGALACFDKGMEFLQARDYIAQLANAEPAGE